jgi:hypothetical protein
MENTLSKMNNVLTYFDKLSPHERKNMISILILKEKYSETPTVNSTLEIIDKLSIDNKVSLFNEMFDKYSTKKIITFHCVDCNDINVLNDLNDTEIECGNCWGLICEKCVKLKAVKCDKCKEIVCTECQGEKLIDGSNICESCNEKTIICDICLEKCEFNCRDEILATFGSCSSCSRDICEKCCEQESIRSCLECEKTYCIECVDEKIPNMKICLDCENKK